MNDNLTTVFIPVQIISVGEWKIKLVFAQRRRNLILVCFALPNVPSQADFLTLDQTNRQLNN